MGYIYNWIISNVYVNIVLKINFKREINDEWSGYVYVIFMR